MSDTRQEHWDKIFATKDEEVVSWFQVRPGTQLLLTGSVTGRGILSAGVPLGREQAMEHLNRRHALLGLAVASTLVPAGRAAAQGSGSPEGREVAPGVRRIDYTKRETLIPNYKTVSMRDNSYQPGAGTSGPSMSNDMVCHMLEAR